MSNELELFTKSEVRGTYKIEVVLVVHDGERNNLVPGELQIFLSGSGTSGDNDQPCFICPHCKKVIQPGLMGAVFYCSHCKQTGHEESASPGFFANLSLQGWADLIFKYWKLLGGDVDIYLKRFKHKMQAAAAEKRAGPSSFLRADVEKRVRAGKHERERVLYPLANSMKDNLAGQDMLKRILAFLNA